MASAEHRSSASVLRSTSHGGAKEGRRWGARGGAVRKPGIRGAEPQMGLWRRLDRDGLEAFRLEREGSSWWLRGTAVLAEHGRPCRLDYEVVCDAAWRTRQALVTGWMGGETVDVALESDGEGRWYSRGKALPRLTGCLDVDLGFSPSTNTLPIRRLNLGMGASERIRAAWVRFPELTLEPLAQVYTRAAEAVYRYQSGRFVARLEVNSAGLVMRYGKYWRWVI